MEEFTGENTSTEPTETADAAGDSTEVVDTTSADVDDMSVEEFAEFEEKAFDKGSDSDEDSDETVATESTTEELDELYKSQMTDTDAKLDKPIVIKVAGKVYKVDSVAELKNLAELGTNATKKYQSIAKHRNTLDYMEDNGISQEDLDYLVQSRGVAPVVRDESVNAVEDIANEILNGSGADAFKEIAAQLPDDVKQAMSNNPQMLAGFNYDVQQGIAGSIMPAVNRYMNVNGMSHQQAYMRARNEHLSQNQSNNNNGDVVIEQVTTPKQMLKNQPKPRGNVKSPSLSREDVDKMSKEEFARFYEDV